MTWGATASGNWVTHLAFGTHACVAAQGIATKRRPVAGCVTTLIHVNTQARGVPVEASLTVTESGMIHSLAPTEPTVGVVTGVDALVAEQVAEFIAGAVTIDETVPWNTPNREVVGVTIMAGVTFTQRLAVSHLAASVGPTHSRGTRLNTLEDSFCILLTCLLTFTITVADTFVGFLAAGCYIWVTHRVGRTDAFVGTRDIDTRGCSMARCLPALIHIYAPVGAGQVTLCTHAFL